MKTIKSSNSTLKISVDDEDFEIVSRFRWRTTKRTRRVHRSIDAKGEKTRDVSLANEVMKTEGVMYDHKDRNPLNNLKANLRPATYSQNAANRTKQNKTSSAYKGVTWSKKSKKWRAQITCNGKFSSLGFYATEIDAARAYDSAAVKLFKDFCNTNFCFVDGETE